LAGELHSYFRHAPAAILSEEAVKTSFSQNRQTDAGVGLMEVIVGVLVTLIICAVVLHLCRIGYERYELSSATTEIAERLALAREQAMSKRESVSVIFNAKANTFGLDRNGNGKLDNIEVEELPGSVKLSEDTVVTFSRKGSLASRSKEPRIAVSNVRNSRYVNISALGAIDID
jgi:Tfp pilus assembly protein FimT